MWKNIGAFGSILMQYASDLADVIFFVASVGFGFFAHILTW